MRLLSFHTRRGTANRHELHVSPNSCFQRSFKIVHASNTSMNTEVLVLGKAVFCIAEQFTVANVIELLRLKL